MGFPIAGVNTLVSIIEILDSNHSIIGSATGFFFKHNKKKYLVTNRHVVINEKEKHYPNYLRLRLHKALSDNCKINNDVDINLYSNGEKCWIEHSNYSENKIDVILLELDEKTLTPDNMGMYNDSKINFMNTDNFLKDIKINIFANVIIVGYPLGFHDRINNLPIYRKGMIASSHKVDFNAQPFFLVDANLHKGTSGSPVFNSPENTLIKDGKGFHTDYSYCLGINSGNYESNGESLGLNIIWYPEAMIEIINGN